jgi:hypothetical protein
MNIIKRSYARVGQAIEFAIGETTTDGVVHCSATTRLGVDEYAVKPDGTIVALFAEPETCAW